MLTPQHTAQLDNPDLHPLCEQLRMSSTLASLVLTAWQIGLWFAKTLVEHQLNERAKQPQANRIATDIKQLASLDLLESI